MSSVLEVRDLRVDVGNEACSAPAVGGVSFDVRKGETVGIVGESGSGKTLTALACLRLVPEPPARIAGGEVLFGGRDLLRLSEEEMRALRGNRIAMVFQDPMTSLNPFLTIERQLTEVLETHRRMPRREARERSLAALAQVGIPDPEKRLWSYPHQLSGGQRQRVMIAMALLCDPAVLLADEPTTALDVTVQAQILSLIKKMQEERGLAVVLITHDLGVVAGMAQRIFVMYAGRIAEEGRTEEVFDHPRHPYTLGLLRSLPRVDEEGRLRPIPGQIPEPGELGPGCPFEPRCEFRTARCAASVPPFLSLSPTHHAACFEAYKV